MVIDHSLSKGLVRAETRGLTDALNLYAGDVLNTFHQRVTSQFAKRSRLSLPEMNLLAADLHDKAKAAFSPLRCDLEILPPTRGRPQSGSFEMLHYWVNPKTVEGTSNRLMMVAMFSAWGTRKQTSIRAHDTLTSFYEHAAQRLLQRCGTKEAAVRAIGERLTDTIIIPTVALYDDPARLIDTEFPIPFMDGLLLGRFISRSPDKPAGDLKTIWKDGWRTRDIRFPAPVEFVVKTFVGPEEITDRQQWTAYQIEAWLSAYRTEAETIRRYISYKLGSLWENGHMSEADFDALVQDFKHLHNKLAADVTPS